MGRTRRCAVCAGGRDSSNQPILLAGTWREVVEAERAGSQARRSRVIRCASPGRGAPLEIEQQPVRAVSRLEVKGVPPATPRRCGRAHRAWIQQPLAAGEIQRYADPDLDRFGAAWRLPPRGRDVGVADQPELGALDREAGCRVGCADVLVHGVARTAVPELHLAASRRGLARTHPLDVGAASRSRASSSTAPPASPARRTGWARPIPSRRSRGCPSAPPRSARACGSPHARGPDPARSCPPATTAPARRTPRPRRSPRQALRHARARRRTLLRPRPEP